MQILSPKRRIDILRDVMLASEKGNPYVITFCGVNGVGKSTNLAKVCVCVCVCACVCVCVCVHVRVHVCAFIAMSPL